VQRWFPLHLEDFSLNVDPTSILCIRDLTPTGDRIRVYFARTKGGKNSAQVLEAETSQALRDYLVAFYGPDWPTLKEKAVWVSLSRNDTYGQQLSIQAIEDIYARRLGTSKSHVTRHTTAHTLAKLGVLLNEIQELLGHENIATTGIYTRSLNRDENKHRCELEQVFGITGQSPDAFVHV
jgi:site-specific recombinase XerD